MELLRSIGRVVGLKWKPTASDSWALVPADRFSPARRAVVLNTAYAGYYVPMCMTPEQMATMERAYDIDLARSAVATAGQEDIGMALLGRRGDRAWLGAVGVVAAWRRQGVGRALVTRLLKAAAQAGASQMTLEVIVQNRPAQNLYVSLGFQAGRELLSWRRPADADPLPIPAERLTPVPPLDLLEYFAAWHDQRPCWQGDVPTLRNIADRLRGYRLDLDGAPVAYALISSGNDAVWLMDVGINPAVGPVTAGRILVQALANLHFGKTITISNVPVDSGLCRVLAALRFLVTVRQTEMALEL